MVHTIEIRLHLKSNKIRENAILNEFEEKDKSYENVSSCKSFKTTIVFINKYMAMIYVKVDIQLLLRRIRIAEKDVDQIKKMISRHIYRMFGMFDPEITVLHTFDYCYDVRMDANTRALFLDLIKCKALDMVDRYEKNIYEDDISPNPTIYYNSRSTKIQLGKKSKTGLSRVLRIYDKEFQSIIEDLVNKEAFINTIRFETSLKNRHLLYNKNRKKIEKVIDSYIDEALYLKYIPEEFKKVIYMGDYMKLEEARKKINKSDIWEEDKERLNEFLLKVSRYSLENAKKLIKSEYLFKKWIKLLNELNINPITIPQQESICFIANPIKDLLNTQIQLKMKI